MSDHNPAATLLSPATIAARLGGLKPQSLRVKRMRGTSPPYVRLGGRTGRVMYPAADFEAWLAAQPRFTGTGEEKAAALDSAPLGAKPQDARARLAEKRTAKAAQP